MSVPEGDIMGKTKTKSKERWNAGTGSRDPQTPWGGQDKRGNRRGPRPHGVIDPDAGEQAKLRHPGSAEHGSQLTADFKRLWTKEEDQKLIKLRKEGHNLAEVGRRLGRSTGSVNGRFDSLSKNGNRAPYSDQEEG